MDFYFKEVTDNYTVVMEIQMDLKEEDGYDRIKITPGEVYKYTGAKNKTARINNNQLTDNNITVDYERSLSQSDVDSWSTVRETGFSLHWWIERDTGDELEMEVKPIFVEENKIFRDWIKTFHQLIEVENVEEKTLIKTVNTVKVDYIVNNNIRLMDNQSEQAK